MRFYKILITDPSGAEIFPSSLGNQRIQSLLPNGQFNPGALNVELDIPVSAFHAPGNGGALLTVWGLSVADIGASFALNPNVTNPTSTKDFYRIAIYGGMSAGLPLAKPAQAGLLVQGGVYQAFGNWVGTDQNVVFVIAPIAGTAPMPMNYVLDWRAGMTLATALQNCFQVALPSAKLNINISPRLVQSHDEPSVYGTLTQLASYMNPISKQVITDANYPGVSVTYDGTTINVFDGTIKPAPKTIAPEDLIGQPTWIAPGQIQIKTVMRGDLDIGDVLNLPQNIITTSAAALTGLTGKSSLTFSGKCTVSDIHHYGNFRSPPSASWNTTVNLIVNQTPSS